MTLAEIRTDLIGKLGNPDVGTDLLNRWINNTYGRLYRKMVQADPYYFASIADVDLVADTQEYDLEVDFNKMIYVNVQWESGGQWYRVNPFADVTQIPVVKRTTSEQGFSKTYPYYYLIGGKIGLMPISGEANSSGLHYRYVPEFTELSTENSEPDIDNEWHELIVWGAALSYNYRDEELGLYQVAEREFEKGMEEFDDYLEDVQTEASDRIEMVHHQELYGRRGESYYHYQE